MHRLRSLRDVPALRWLAVFGSAAAMWVLLSPWMLPGGPYGRVESIALSADRRVVTMQVFGKPAGSAPGPCDADYSGWAKVEGDTLRVVALEVSPPFSITWIDVACPSVAGIHVVEVELPEPFYGTTATDIGGAWIPLTLDGPTRDPLSPRVPGPR
jgi:hypothetical protein